MPTQSTLNPREQAIEKLKEAHDILTKSGQQMNFSTLSEMVHYGLLSRDDAEKWGYPQEYFDCAVCGDSHGISAKLRLGREGEEIQNDPEMKNLHSYHDLCLELFQNYSTCTLWERIKYGWKEFWRLVKNKEILHDVYLRGNELTKFADFLKMYPETGHKKFVYDYPRPAVTCDVALVQPLYSSIKECHYYGFDILLIQRRDEPFKGSWALPGGFLEMDETCEEGATRELKEETGIIRKIHPVELFDIQSDPNRDPRGRVIDVVYLSVLDPDEEKPEVIPSDDAIDYTWHRIELQDDIPDMPFDHKEILERIYLQMQKMNR